MNPNPYLFIVIHAVDYSRKDGVFGTGELDLFLGKNFLVTYHTVHLKSITVTEETAIKGTMHIARAPDRVAYTVLDSIRYNRSDTALVRVVVNVTGGDVQRASDTAKLWSDAKSWSFSCWNVATALS